MLSPPLWVAACPILCEVVVREAGSDRIEKKGRTLIRVILYGSRARITGTVTARSVAR